MEANGFDGPVPVVVLEQYVVLDFDAFLTVPDSRRGPVTGVYERPGRGEPQELVREGRLSPDETEGNPLGMLEDPAYERTLVGTEFLERSSDPEFDPLRDPQGCLWRTLGSVLADALGVDGTEDLSTVEEIFQLNEVLWAEFDERWALCMRIAGHDYSYVEDPYFEFVDDDGGSEELDVARADVDCRASVLGDPHYREVFDRLNAEAGRMAEPIDP